MYKNLMTEMARNGLLLNDMVHYLSLSRSILSNKIKAKAKFTLDEAFDIHKIYFSDLDFKHVFERFKIQSFVLDNFQ